MDLRPLVGLSLLLVTGCGGGGTDRETPPRRLEPTGAGAEGEAAPPPEPVPDRESLCRERLSRFGDEAIARELDECVEAVTTGWELEDCARRGLGDDYADCVDSCMGSVDLGAEYVPGDVMGNCRGPCHQVTCTDEAT